MVLLCASYIKRYNKSIFRETFGTLSIYCSQPGYVNLTGRYLTFKFLLKFSKISGMEMDDGYGALEERGSWFVIFDQVSLKIRIN
jgi:hypothetical protein